MNIPEIYLIEPYNAYAPKGQKKHWMQEVEEQALLARIIAEQTQLQEAKSNTLPPQAPPNSVNTVQHYSGGEGAAGNSNSNGACGGAPRPQFFTPESASYSCTITPSTSSAPTIVQVSVNGGSNTFALNGAVANWNWGDGTTGAGQSTSHTYTSTGSFTIIMSVSASINNANLGTQIAQVTMSVPTVSSAFTLTGATAVLNNGFYTASHNDTLTFINGATSNNPSNPLTYLWTFTSASVTSTATNPTLLFTSASIYPVTLGVSGSFNTIATGTRNVCIT